MDEKYIRNDCVLGAFPVDGFRHTGEFLAEKISNCLLEHGISIEKMVFSKAGLIYGNKLRNRFNF